MAVQRKAFGKNQFDEEVALFTLSNSNGVRVRIMNHGGTIVSIEVPDRNGNTADVVLGCAKAADYAKSPYFGSVIGRFANRIADGKFTLNGAQHTLAINNGPNALHGGTRGFDKVIWKTDILEDEHGIRMTYISADGEEGYPGEVTTTMTYTLTNENALQIDYLAETTHETPLNLTNHSYFNLAGHDAGPITDHVLTLNADTFLPADENSIPYGEVVSVTGTPMDFRTPTAMGDRINADFEPIQFGAGYDHNYCLNKKTAAADWAARVVDPVSGRVMDTYTTEPGVQFYTANYLDGTLTGKDGCNYVRRGGFCLETQHYPDSPNKPQFPSCILKPCTPYRSQTIYKFSVEA